MAYHVIKSDILEERMVWIVNIQKIKVNYMKFRTIRKYY